MYKKVKRLKRARKTRAIISSLAQNRLSVHRTPKHIYAQIISAIDGCVLASSSTLDAVVKNQLAGYTGNKSAAQIVGRTIAEKALGVGIQSVAFDRSGFKYHGRIKSLADAAREAGLNF